MSYTLYYKSAFLKVKDLYLPMFESADSNLYESLCPSKRVRDWGNTIFSEHEILLNKNEVLALPNEINERLKNRNKDYTDNILFGYYYGISVNSKKPINTTYNDFKNMFSNGIKYALTLDDLKRLGIILHAYVYDKSEDFCKKPINIKTEDDIIEAIKANKTVWFSYFGLFEDKYNYIKAICRKDDKSSKKEFIVVTNLGYIKDFNGLMPIYTHDKDEAKRFTNLVSKYIVNGLSIIDKDIVSVGNMRA